MTVQQRATRTGLGFFKLIKSIFRFGIVPIVFLAILINAFFLVYKEKSVIPLIRELGSRVVIATVGLNDSALEIISAATDISLWAKLLLVVSLIGSGIFIYGWIKLFTRLGKFMFGEAIPIVILIAFSAVVVLLLQYGFILLLISGLVDGIPGVDQIISHENPLDIPHESFINFGKSLAVIVSWITSLWNPSI